VLASVVPPCRPNEVNVSSGRRPSIYGAILGGFLFAALQTIGTVALPFASAYKDVFAFTVVIALIAWRPTGLIQEKISERV
jgi:branched-chain amino acid transport system permease protein